MTWRARLRELKLSAHAVWIGARDPAVPLAVRLFGLAVAAYAFSPIDLIPDFIPVLGLLDDLMLVPLGIWLFIRLIPPDLHAAHRALAKDAALRPTSRGGAFVIVAVWLIAAIWLGGLLWSARFW